jgi:orotidine-5'-phosphate decarboxylase
MSYNPIICAIDTTDIAQAKKLVAAVRPHVGAVKLGLEFFVAHGAAGVREVAGDAPLFLDLKFHDIPNTVAGAVRSTEGINCFLLTLHAAGGAAMLRAAKEAALTLSSKPQVVAVTLLTSLDAQDVADIGVVDGIPAQVKRLAELTHQSGVDGVVCSPHEIEILRKHLPADFVLVVPGIRPAGSASGDQKRTMTPKEAVAAGATYVVIGRPITESADPARAAADILASLA